MKVTASIMLTIDGVYHGLGGPYGLGGPDADRRSQTHNLDLVVTIDVDRG